MAPPGPALRITHRRAGYGAGGRFLLALLAGPHRLVLEGRLALSVHNVQPSALVLRPHRPGAVGARGGPEPEPGSPGRPPGPPDVAAFLAGLASAPLSASGLSALPYALLWEVKGDLLESGELEARNPYRRVTPVPLHYLLCGAGLPGESSLRRAFGGEAGGVAGEDPRGDSRGDPRGEPRGDPRGDSRGGPRPFELSALGLDEAPEPVHVFFVASALFSKRMSAFPARGYASGPSQRPAQHSFLQSFSLTDLSWGDPGMLPFCDGACFRRGPADAALIPLLPGDVVASSGSELSRRGNRRESVTFSERCTLFVVNRAPGPPGRVSGASWGAGAPAAPSAPGAPQAPGRDADLTRIEIPLFWNWRCHLFYLMMLRNLEALRRCSRPREVFHLSFNPDPRGFCAVTDVIYQRPEGARGEGGAGWEAGVPPAPAASAARSPLSLCLSPDAGFLRRLEADSPGFRTLKDIASSQTDLCLRLGTVEASDGAARAGGDAILALHGATLGAPQSAAEALRAMARRGVRVAFSQSQYSGGSDCLIPVTAPEPGEGLAGRHAGSSVDIGVPPPPCESAIPSPVWLYCRQNSFSNVRLLSEDPRIFDRPTRDDIWSEPLRSLQTPWPIAELLAVLRDESGKLVEDLTALPDAGLGELGEFAEGPRAPRPPGGPPGQNTPRQPVSPRREERPGQPGKGALPEPRIIPPHPSSPPPPSTLREPNISLPPSFPEPPGPGGGQGGGKRNPTPGSGSSEPGEPVEPAEPAEPRTFRVPSAEQAAPGPQPAPGDGEKEPNTAPEPEGEENVIQEPHVPLGDPDPLLLRSPEIPALRAGPALLPRDRVSLLLATLDFAPGPLLLRRSGDPQLLIDYSVPPAVFSLRPLGISATGSGWGDEGRRAGPGAPEGSSLPFAPTPPSQDAPWSPGGGGERKQRARPRAARGALLETMNVFALPVRLRGVSRVINRAVPFSPESLYAYPLCVVSASALIDFFGSLVPCPLDSPEDPLPLRYGKFIGVQAVIGVLNAENPADRDRSVLRILRLWPLPESRHVPFEAPLL